MIEISGPVEYSTIVEYSTCGTPITWHTQRIFEKTQSPHTPEQKARHMGTLKKTQSLHTPQHMAHTQKNYFLFRGILQKAQSFPA